MKSTVVKFGLVLLVISLLAITNVSALFGPCLTCGGGGDNTGPYDGYSTTSLGINVNPSTVKVGQSVNLNAYQITGTSVSSAATWSWNIIALGDTRGITGQSVTFVPSLRSKTYQVRVSVVDPVNQVIGSGLLSRGFTTK